MKITIHQALYGENPKKAWGLLKTTLPDTTVARDLAFKTGLQDNTQGIKWEPAIRGFTEGNYFLIMKTFPDTSPDVRQGRAFSHALIIPVNEISQCTSLKEILALLPQSMDKEAAIAPINITCKTEQVGNLPVAFTKRFNLVIHGLLNHPQYHNTIVWVGQKDMELAVEQLWQRLTPEERVELNFGIYFSTDNIDSDSLNFITVPDPVQSKFYNKGFLLINPDANYKPETLGEKIFSNDALAIKKITEFKNQLDISEIKRSDLDAISIVMPTFENLEQIKDLKKVNTLANVIALLSPSPKMGVTFKKRLIEHLAEILNQDRTGDVLILKNFKTDSFQGAEKKLIDGMGLWLKSNAYKTKSFDAVLDAKVVSLLDTDKRNWLYKTIVQYSKNFFETINKTKAELVWHWMDKAPELVDKVINYISHPLVTEKFFIQALPKKIATALANTGQKFALAQNWYQLYAHITMKILSPEKALDLQMSVDTDPQSVEAIRYIANAIKPKNLMEIVTKSSDNRLIALGADVCKTSPEVLESLDLSIELNQQIILTYRIPYGWKWLENIKNLTKFSDKILDLLIQEKKIDPQIIEDISNSASANVLRYKDRDLLWNKIHEPYRTKFLQKTSSTLLEDLSKNANTKVPNDEVLSDYIMSNGISEFLYYNSNKIQSTLPIFLRYTNIPEHYIDSYLKNYHGDINPVEAKQLGKLIIGRKLKSVAYTINGKASKHNNWRIALAECHFLLDTLTKLVLAFAGTIKRVNIPSDEWWALVEEFIVHHYSNVTALTTIWRKSGGKEFDLNINGTTQESWHTVLVKLRHGVLKNPSMSELLKQIDKDYGNDGKFKLLYDIRKSYIKK